MPITHTAEVRDIAAEIRDVGRFALDLEFLSESRYVPELCLVQVGWGDPEDPEVVAVDPHDADPEPIFELVEDAGVETVLHSLQGDLALLSDRFDVVGRGVVDTQVAAAFLGLGDQVGYGNLVEEMTGVSLDKGAQFTDWCRRPLSEEQLRYALDDVRYLPRVWRDLRRDLEERGRLTWVEEESARVARDAAERTPPEETYRRVRGWHRLGEEGRAVLRELAAWREREALASNTPPGWLLKNGALLEVARHRPADERALRSVRGVPGKTVRRHADAILRAVRDAELPAPSPERRRRLPSRAKGWGSELLALVRERCDEADVATRFVASRADADALVLWWLEDGGDGAEEPDLPLLSGWRRELAGREALEWLARRTDGGGGA